MREPAEPEQQTIFQEHRLLMRVVGEEALPAEMVGLVEPGEAEVVVGEEARELPRKMVRQTLAAAAAAEIIPTVKSVATAALG